MPKYVLSNKEARQFILLKQGLISDYKFTLKNGVCDFIKQAGCIQFDPIDVCGKNAELVLQSRVKGFTKKMLYELLYEERKLIDYFDKNLSIICTDDWKYFCRIRDYYKGHGLSREEIDEVTGEIKKLIIEKEYISSKDINFNRKVNWYWNKTNLSRAALETLYFRGDLIIHHKKGAIKYYAFSENFIPKHILNAPDPNKTEFEFMKWRVLRRISAVGFLWSNPSDAWLNIDNFNSENRNKVFNALLNEEKIIEIEVENQKHLFYCLSSDLSLINMVTSSGGLKERTELIAPLDNMLWDRKLIKSIFDFDYKWEIYTPVKDRKFGYYTLPIISGIKFIGRAEIINDKKSSTLIIKNIWYEKDMRKSKKLELNLKKCFQRFAEFNNCNNIIYDHLQI